MATPARAVYAALAVLTIAVGLTVHIAGVALPPTARDFAGDALWAMMMTWLVSALTPRTPLAARAGVSLAICYVVEASQLLHTPSLDAVRATTPGHLVLGSGFDPRDLLAYAVGVLAAAIVDRGWRRRASA